MISIGQRDDGLHFSPFHPILEFPGRIAGIGADLESREDNNFHFQRMLRSRHVAGSIISFADGR